MKLELSFPVRIVLLIGLLIVVPGVVIGTNYLAQGYVQFSSSIPKAIVVETDTEVQHDVPAKVLKRVGKRVFTLYAPGYASEDVEIRVPSFRLTKKHEFTLTKKLYDEEDPEAMKKVPLASELPYRTADFEVEIPDEDGAFPIFLSPDLITVPGVSGSDLDKSLKEDKPKAIQWLTSKGVKPGDIKIKWLPYDPDTGP